MSLTPFLGINIDHVATLREARGTCYPSPLKAAWAAIQGGADSITLHLREDRRHIQEKDLALLKQNMTAPINLEMALTDSMLNIAEKYQPARVCLVPEQRAELTTEGGLDVVAQISKIRIATQYLSELGIRVSLFIDPNTSQIEAALHCGVKHIEIHTGHYANATTPEAQKNQLTQIQLATHYATQQGLTVEAGHGLHEENLTSIIAIPHIIGLNIGHSIIAQALFDGLKNVVQRVKKLMCKTVSSNTKPVV